MTVVRPNSIAGINSITVQTGQALNIHDASGNLIRNITSSSGVSTFSSLHVGAGTTTSTQGISVGTGCSIVSTTVNQLELYTNSSQRLKITSGGLITQSNTWTNTYSATDTTHCGYQVHNLSDTTDTYAALRLTSGSSSPATAQIASVRKGTGSNDITFQLEASNTAKEALRITSDGHFGTGGVTPTTQSGKVFHLHAGAAQQRLHMTNNTTGVSATDGFEIIVEEGANTRVRNFEAGDMAFDTGGTDNEIMRITNGGKLLLAHTSSHTDMHGKIQVCSATSQGIDIARYTANAHPPYLNLFKSRNGTTGGNTIVQDDDTVGYIAGNGNDGSGFHSCAAIAFRIDGTPGNDDMPGRIDFETVADGGTTITNRMSILNTGTVQIMSELLSLGSSANTGGASSGMLGFEFAGNVKNAIKTRNTHSGNGNAMVMITGSTEVGSIVQNTSSTTYNTSSDYRLKENAVGITSAITRLKTLKPYRFNWKSDSSTTVDGFFAHEVTAVPEAIKGTKDAVASEDIDSLNIKKDDPIYQQIDHSKLVPLLTAALQDAITKIETLETEVAALKSS